MDILHAGIEECSATSPGQYHHDSGRYVLRANLNVLLTGTRRLGGRDDRFCQFTNRFG